MSVATQAHQKHRGGRTAGLWIAFLVLIAAALALALAWLGAGSLRPEVTSSGLQFRTISPGSGPTIQRSDTALLDYVLTSADGTVFDSSASSNNGQPVPLSIDGVYPGFGEAMSKMQAGGEYRFTMPENLAFVQSPPPPGWPKGSPLTFDVRIRKIESTAKLQALMQQMQQQQMQQQQMQQQQGALQQ